MPAEYIEELALIRISQMQFEIRSRWTGDVKLGAGRLRKLFQYDPETGEFFSALARRDAAVPVIVPDP